LRSRLALPQDARSTLRTSFLWVSLTSSLKLLPDMYRTWYTLLVGKKLQSPAGVATQPEALERQGKRVPAIFFRTEGGGEPVRDWLKALPSPEDRKRIGEDIKTVEFGWPIGMPVCRPLGSGIYEVRTSLAQNRIARVLFYIDKKSRMVLLHGFIKKTHKTPGEDLELARKNKSKHQLGLR
jgi:phage-related protein